MTDLVQGRLARGILLLSALSVAGLGWAQEPTDAPIATPPNTPDANAPPVSTSPEIVAPAQPKKEQGEQIEVLGTRLKRKDLTTPAPVTVITKQQLQASGVASVGDFLQMLPEQGNAPNTNVNNGGDGSTLISLRSLGPQRTLVLVDGKRFVASGGGAGFGGAGNAVDLNSIPSAAIERVEILKDGASALYGSDAIGGVVNIITRKKMNGVEASVYTGVSGHGDANVYDINLTGGATGDRGSFLVGVGYFDQQPFFASARPWANSPLKYNFATGQTTRSGSATTPQGRVTLDPSSCPTQLCKDLAAAFGAGKNAFTYDPSSAGNVDGWRLATNDVYNFQQVNYLVTPSQRLSLFGNGEAKLGDFSRLYVQTTFVNRHSSNLAAPEPLTTSGFGITVSAQNEFNPFGIDLTNVRRRLVEYSGRTQTDDLITFRAIAGIDGTLPDSMGFFRGWYYDLSFNYGRSVGLATSYGTVNTQLTGAGLGPSFQDGQGNWQCGTAANPSNSPNCTPVDILHGPGTLTPAMIGALGGYKGINQEVTQLVSTQANISGDLFSLFADRPVGLAAGFEHRNEYGGAIPNPIAQQGLDSDFNGQPTIGGFYVNELYGELSVPIVNHLPGAEELELQAAVRYSSYSTYGNTTTFKAGARWSPVRDVTFRGTYSTGFRAPSIAELFLGRAPSAEPTSDPCAAPATPAVAAQCGAAAGSGDPANQINSNVGGNPKLLPERSKSATAGVVIEPRAIRGFSVTLDYFNVNLDNAIGPVTTPIILKACYPGAGFTPKQVLCNNIHRDPTTQLISAVDDYNVNLGSLSTSGLDFAVRYSIPTAAGRFGALFNSTYLINYDQNLAGIFLVHGVNNYDLGVNPALKFQAGLTYTLSGFNAGLVAHFVGPLHECANSNGISGGDGQCWEQNADASGNPFPTHAIPAYATFDLNAAYTFKSFGTTTISAGVRNIGNATPPQIFDNLLTYADPSAYDFVGRFFYARLSQAF